jgi:hypothetical protein
MAGPLASAGDSCQKASAGRGGGTHRRNALPEPLLVPGSLSREGGVRRQQQHREEDQQQKVEVELHGCCWGEGRKEGRKEEEATDGVTEWCNAARSLAVLCWLPTCLLVLRLSASARKGKGHSPRLYEWPTPILGELRQSARPSSCPQAPLFNRLARYPIIRLFLVGKTPCVFFNFYKKRRVIPTPIFAVSL